jgi:hypothetical protein
MKSKQIVGAEARRLFLWRILTLIHLTVGRCGPRRGRA